MPNTLSLVQYGHYASSAESDYGTVSAGSSRASVYPLSSNNLWAWRFGGIVGRPTATSPTFRWSLSDTDSSKNPRTRQGYSATATASASYTGAPPGTTIGALVNALVEVSDVGPSSAGIPLFSGQRYAIDIDVSGAALNHSMINSKTPGIDNYLFYNRTGVATPPPVAYGTYSSSVQGNQTQWVDCWVNVAPVTPSTGLAPSGSSSGSSPTFTADFRDLNGAYGASSGNGINSGDQLNQYQIQVRRISDQVLFWNPTSSLNATAAEKSANAMSLPYGGTTLVRGTAYEWRVRMSDFHSTWSGWSAWTSFTPVSLGFVTLDNTPTGKILAVSGSTALDFHGRWNHQTAATMTLAQVQLLDGNGTILQTGAQAAPTSAPIASSALPGTLFTATWAQTGFSALGWGRSYQYKIRGYDGSQWSDWSAARVFTTDAAPSVPVIGSPAGGLVTTAFPLLRGSFSDADNASASGLTGVMRITRPDATTVDVTPTYNSAATHDPWQFQTTATQLNQYGLYTWMLTGYDGTLYSGESTTLTGATWSSQATFDYEQGPVVTVTTPVDGSVVGSSSFNVFWTTSGQQKFQVKLYADGTNTVIYDSGLQISTTVNFWTIPSGYVRNGVNYDLVVLITNATPLTGSSGIVNISVAFTPPNPVQNITATVTNDYSIRVAFDQTTYAAGQFVETRLTMTADGGPDAGTRTVAHLTSPTDVAYIFDAPADNATYTFGATVVILTGVDLVESATVSASATVNIPATVLSLLGNGQTYRVVLPNVTDREHDRQLSEAVYPSLSGARPVTIRSRVRYWQSSFTALIVAAGGKTADQILADFDALDAQNGVVVYRDGIGRKRFCKITDYKVIDQKPGDWYSVTFGLREETGSESAP